jgi:hypothetical protein
MCRVTVLSDDHTQSTGTGSTGQRIRLKPGAAPDGCDGTLDAAAGKEERAQDDDDRLSPALSRAHYNRGSVRNVVGEVEDDVVKPARGNAQEVRIAMVA